MFHTCKPCKLRQNTTSCLPRCCFSPGRSSKTATSAAPSFLTFFFLLFWNPFLPTQYYLNPFRPGRFPFPRFTFHPLPSPRHRYSNIQSIPLAPKPTSEIWLCALTHRYCDPNIHRIPCAPLARQSSYYPCSPIRTGLNLPFIEQFL